MGGIRMDDRIKALYAIPNIADYEDVCLQELRENCSALETQVAELVQQLPQHDRCVIEAYLDIRDELEFQTIKTALRWGKRHYK